MPKPLGCVTTILSFSKIDTPNILVDVVALVTPDVAEIVTVGFPESAEPANVPKLPPHIVGFACGLPTKLI